MWKCLAVTLLCLLTLPLTALGDGGCPQHTVAMTDPEIAQDTHRGGHHQDAPQPAADLPPQHGSDCDLLCLSLCSTASALITPTWQWLPATPAQFSLAAGQPASPAHTLPLLRPPAHVIA
ncbi:hypothetical protein [Isoalcanivorax indicus]|uniref:hypothetical protein n=1 Tax=Isoalcanivorax indicus TaxID=2202653 RepID=UPI000DBA793C|nr:hypothetical protein [Isoalcanivorax indicus]